MLAHRAPARSNLHGFGRRRPFVHVQEVDVPSSLGEDLRLFLLNFVAGLVFMAIYLA